MGQAKERQLSGLKKGTRPLQSKDVNGDGKETKSKSNQGKRNDLTLAPAEPEVKSGRTITQAHIKRFKPC